MARTSRLVLRHLRLGMHPARVVVAAVVLIALSSCASNGSRRDAAASSATPSTARSSFAVTSSIADGAHLQRATPWSAQVSPAGNVASVDFLVDGKVEWTEHKAPYFFNDDNNLLPPGCSAAARTS